MALSTRLTTLGDGEAPPSTMEIAKGRVGTTISGKWTLESMLGIGGYGAVYSATHRNGRRVALKMLHPELRIDLTARRRFLREGFVSNKIKHSGIVSVLDDDVAEDGSMFLVMELLEGDTLQARLDGRQRVPLAQVLDVLDQALDVLAAAHDAGVIHRDIKPANLFLTNEGALKVLDFGIAHAEDGASQAFVTKTGSILGTPAFMSPEQAKGDWSEVDGRADLWSLGATAFLLLTGVAVRRAGTVNQELVLALTAPAPRIGKLAPHLPESVKTLIDRSLEFRARDRWPDARSMQRAVRQVRSGLELGGPDRASRKGLWMALVAIPLAIGAAALSLPEEETPPRQPQSSPREAKVAAPVEQPEATKDEAPNSASMEPSVEAEPGIRPEPAVSPEPPAAVKKPKPKKVPRRKPPKGQPSRESSEDDLFDRRL